MTNNVQSLGASTKVFNSGSTTIIWHDDGDGVVGKGDTLIVASHAGCSVTSTTLAGAGQDMTGYKMSGDPHLGSIEANAIASASILANARVIFESGAADVSSAASQLQNTLAAADERAIGDIQDDVTLRDANAQIDFQVIRGSAEATYAITDGIDIILDGNVKQVISVGNIYQGGALTVSDSTNDVSKREVTAQEIGDRIFTVMRESPLDPSTDVTGIMTYGKKFRTNDDAVGTHLIVDVHGSIGASTERTSFDDFLLIAGQYRHEMPSRVLDRSANEAEEAILAAAARTRTAVVGTDVQTEVLQPSTSTSKTTTTTTSSGVGAGAFANA